MRGVLVGFGVILLISCVLAGLFLVDPTFLENLRSNDVLAVSSINLQQNGVAGSDGALNGGAWRILATTGSADTYFLQLNQSTLDQYHASYPDDVQVTGSTTFGAFQTFNPYWYLPVSKVKDVTVYPKISGMYKLDQSSAYTVPPMVVSVWQTQPSQMQLIIPFSIGIVKTFGSNLGSFKTDYPGAKIQSSSTGNYYSFSISAESIHSGNMTNIINFYNPNDNKETVKITLQFTVDSSYQFPSEPWVIVTEQNGGEVSNNVFRSSDLQTILSILDYAQGNDWSYYHYLYGGGSIYVGRGYASFGSGSSENPEDRPLATWSDGSVAPKFVKPVAPYGTYTFVLAEGYCYPTSTTNQHFQFPGWYVPSPNNNEGVSLGSDYWNYRLPIAGTLHNDLQNTVPAGMSLVNYLAMPFTYQGRVKPFTLQRVNVDYWGFGGQGSCPAGIGVMIPKGARQWLFTLDVSTEAVDSIVVVQNYIDVRISNFRVDRDTIGKDQTATVTATLTNNSPFAGSVSVGINIPSSLSYSVTTSGGTGLMHFGPAGAGDASQQFTFSITNTGNFIEDTGAQSLVLRVTNTEPRITDSKSFTLNFLKGLGVPDTAVIVTCQDADSNMRIDGVNVQVFYGQRMDQVTSTLSTIDGSATFTLGVYTGYAKVVVADNAGRYEGQDKTIGPLVAGSNMVTFSLVKVGEGFTIDNTLLMWIALVALAVVAVVAIAVAVKKRR